MKRKLLIAFLALGTIGGFGSGIASMSCWHHRPEARRAAFAAHVADVCVEAALRARDAEAPIDRPPPPPPRHRHHGYDYGWQ